MKIDEIKKFTLTLFLLPWIPAFLLYKHGYIIMATRVFIIFIMLSVFCALNRKFAIKFKEKIDKFGNFLGRYIAIFVLFIGYIVAVIPTGIIMRIVKRDRLLLKKPDKSTYWLDNKTEKTDYEYQF